MDCTNIPNIQLLMLYAALNLMLHRVPRCAGIFPETHDAGAAQRMYLSVCKEISLREGSGSLYGT